MNLIDYLEFSTEPNMYVMGTISTGMQERYIILPESHVDEVMHLLLQKYPEKQMYIESCFNIPNKQFLITLLKSLVSPDFIGQLEAREKQQTNLYKSEDLYNQVNDEFGELAVDKSGVTPMDVIGGHMNNGIDGSVSTNQPTTHDYVQEKVDSLNEEISTLSETNISLLENLSEKDSEISRLESLVEDKSKEISQKENSIAILEGRLDEQEAGVTEEAYNEVISECQELKEEITKLKAEVNLLTTEKETLLQTLESSALTIKSYEEKLITVTKNCEEALKAKNKDIDLDEELIAAEDVNILFEKLLSVPAEMCKKILIGSIYDEAKRSTTNTRELTSLCRIVYSKYYALVGDINE